MWWVSSKLSVGQRSAGLAPSLCGEITCGTTQCSPCSCWPWPPLGHRQRALVGLAGVGSEVAWHQVEPSSDCSCLNFAAAGWKSSHSLFCCLGWDHRTCQSAATSVGCHSWICEDLPPHPDVSALPEHGLIPARHFPMEQCPGGGEPALLSVALKFHAAGMQLVVLHRSSMPVDAYMMLHTHCGTFLCVNWDALLQTPHLSLQQLETET